MPAALGTEKPTAALPTKVPAAPAPSAETVPTLGDREEPTPQSPVVIAAVPTPDKPHHDSHNALSFAVSDPTSRSGSAPSTSANRQSTVVVEAAATPTSTAPPRTATSTGVESLASTYSAAAADALETRAFPVVSSNPLPPPNIVSGMVSNVLKSFGLNPFASDTPFAPVEPPALWALLAWVRRPNQQELVEQTPTISKTPAQSSQTVDSVASGITALSTPVSKVAADVTSSAPATMNVAAAAAAAAAVAAPAYVQVNAATPQTDRSAVSVAYTQAQLAGDTNILVIGWNNATSNITSVTDLAGNVYRVAVPTARGAGVSQAIYYANNTKAAVAGTNVVSVTFDRRTPYIDIRALEYSGLDPVNPFDVGASAAGSGTAADSGTVRTTAPGLVFGAGTTGGVLLDRGSELHHPHHHRPTPTSPETSLSPQPAPTAPPHR